MSAGHAASAPAGAKRFGAFSGVFTTLLVASSPAFEGTAVLFEEADLAEVDGGAEP